MSILGVALKAVCTGSAAYMILQAWNYLTSPIRGIPGPFLAKFTNLWRLVDTYNGRSELTHQLLHKRYGPAVRIGPNLVSLGDPSLLHKIYDSRGIFKKTEFYSVNDTKVGNATIRNIFSTRSNSEHTQKRGLLSALYKTTNLLRFEALVDGTITTFCKRLDEEFVNGPNEQQICRIDEWLLFFAWDVIGQLTFKKPMGFIEKGSDYSGLLETSEKALDYFAVVGQIPQLDYLLAKNPIMPMGPPSFDVATAFCAQQYVARRQDPEPQAGRKDMLDDFLEIERKSPEKMKDNGVISALLINIIAGSDTTATLLRAIVYYVLKNPRVYRKLRNELDDASLASPVSFSAAKKLPYLEAVILEACRFHPGVGLLLERVVPESGLELANGIILPPGTNVGMNPWVIHRDKGIFGDDAGVFRPERWLRDDDEAENDYRVRVANMKRHDLTFGAGKRVCIGKDMAMIETYKITATMFLTYNMSFENAEKEWSMQNSWFVRQSGINVKLERRI